MKVYLMRHGQTTGDVEDRYGGAYDDHLTELGRDQALQLAQEMKGKGIEIIYTSSLIRAQEVAKTLSEVLDCNVKTLTDWRERNNWGILSGMVKSEAKQKYPKQVELLRDKNNPVEGGESYQDFRTRIVTSFNELIKNNQNTICVITHGGPMKVVYLEILKLGEIEKVDDCGWLELEVLGNKITVLEQKGIAVTKKPQSDFLEKP